VASDIGPILAALAAGAASSLSPYAARGIGTAANVLGQFGESRERRLREQRVQEALAEEKRQKAEIESKTIDFLTKNTEYAPKLWPIGISNEAPAPAAGSGRGIPEQQAQLLKLLAVGRGAGPALEGAAGILSQRATRERKPTLEEARKFGAPGPGESFSVPTEEGISYSRTGLREPAERAPSIRSEYGRESRIDPETGRVLWQRPVREAPREPKEPKIGGLTTMQRDQLHDEVAALQREAAKVRGNLDLGDDDRLQSLQSIADQMNAKFKLLRENRRMTVRPEMVVRKRITKKGDQVVREEVLSPESPPRSGSATPPAPTPTPAFRYNPATRQLERF